jgi:uncharacterized protein (TIGR03000 family)
MYSVVLMVAMTGGADVPAGFFGHGSCSGDCYGSCYGYSCHGGHSCHGGWFSGHGHSCHGGWGCNGSCYGYSCNGCYGYSCHGGHSCHGGWFSGHHSCHGGWGCSGSCYGSCYGYSCNGCYGNSCHGGHGGWFGHRHHNYDCCCQPACYDCCNACACYGAPAGCYGAPAAAPMAPPAEKIEKKPVEKTGELQTAAPATLIVSVPADAKVLVDDATTASTSTRRVFVSPTLPAGREFTYTLKAEYTKNGKAVVVTKDINVTAGAEITVTLEDGLADVASR